MNKYLIRDGMLEALPQFFNDTCTIQENTPARDAHGHPVPSWSNLAGHVDLPCAFAPVEVLGNKGERDLPDRIFVRGSHHATLQDYYPSVTEAMRAVIGGVNYDILMVEHDSKDTMTRLYLEVVQ